MSLAFASIVAEPVTEQANSLIFEEQVSSGSSNPFLSQLSMKSKILGGGPLEIQLNN